MITGSSDSLFLPKPTHPVHELYGVRYPALSIHCQRAAICSVIFFVWMEPWWGRFAVPFKDLLTCRSVADVSNPLSPVLARLSTGSSCGTQFCFRSWIDRAARPHAKSSLKGAAFCGLLMLRVFSFLRIDQVERMKLSSFMFVTS